LHGAGSCPPHPALAWSPGYCPDELHRDDRRRAGLRHERRAFASREPGVARHRPGQCGGRLPGSHARRGRHQPDGGEPPSGARTQLAEVMTAGATLVTMLFLAPLIELMPQATLAAVVIFYSIGLIHVEDFRAILAIRRTEFIWALAAFAGWC